MVNRKTSYDTREAFAATKQRCIESTRWAKEDLAKANEKIAELEKENSRLHELEEERSRLEAEYSRLHELEAERSRLEKEVARLTAQLNRK